MDYWQLASALAASFFTFGFLDQCRLSYQTRNVEGLSLPQWLLFFLASTVFLAYYAHLEQWLMVAVSVLGTACCLAIVLMIIAYRKPST